MVNNSTLRDFILRKRELLFAGGSVIAPAAEPVRISYLPANASSGGILGVHTAAACGFHIFPNLMHERIVCDMILSYFQTLAGSCITAVVRDVDWDSAEANHGQATSACTHASTKFMVVSTRFTTLRLLRTAVEQAGGMPFWFQSPYRMLHGVFPRHDPSIIPCRLQVTEDHAKAAERERQRLLAIRSFKIDFHLQGEAAKTAITRLYPRDTDGRVLSGRLFSTFEAARSNLSPAALEEVGGWVSALINISLWADGQGVFTGHGLTIGLASEDARTAFLEWTLRRHRATLEGAYSSTDGLWDALPHRICGGSGFEVFIPDVRAQDGSTSSVSAYAYLLQQRRLLAMAPTAPRPPLPPEVTNCPPIPWSARVSPKSAPAAQAVVKAQALIKEFISTSREPAFLIAANAFGLGPPADSRMGGIGADEGMGEEILYDIPFNAECAWKAERQLAPHMAANGSSAAATYAAVDSLLLDTPPTIGLEACERRPFYIILNLVTPPPISTALVVAGPGPTRRDQAATKPASGTAKRRCRNGPSCPNKASCPFDHTPPSTTPGSARSRRSPQAAGSGGSSSGSSRASKPVPRGWGPN
jgi:hypothetical protein